MDGILALLGWWVAWLGGAGDDPACLALGRLDLERSVAYWRGDVEALEAVYVDPAVAADDVAILQGYLDRGLRVQVTVERLECRRDGEALDVVDRVVARADGRALPRDAPTRHRIVLHRAEGVWRIASVE